MALPLRYHADFDSIKNNIIFIVFRKLKRSGLLPSRLSGALVRLVLR